jgi:hypothetical protein
MKITVGVLLALQVLAASAKHSHEVLGAVGKRHQHQHHARHAHPSPAESKLVATEPKVKRDGQCQFPSDAGLFAVTPGSENAGWAMSPDQPCTPGKYCPYACPPGQVMAQWDPDATSYPSMVRLRSLVMYMANVYRTVDCTVMTMVTSRNHSLTSHTVWMVQILLAPRIRLARALPFARLSYQVMKPC